MATVITSPNMNLPVPVVGQEAGPTYATDINNCLNIIDGHDHSIGYGTQITPSGININTSLSFNDYNATNLRSSRFFIQPSLLALATDLCCTYVSGVDLYYNDGNGNQIRMTQSGAVSGTPGSISGLSSPASASYNSGNQTFVWQSAANTPANMDGGSFIFRNITASSNGVTVSAPAALGSNYSLVLPSIPAQTNVMTLDTSGNMGSITYNAVAAAMTATGANAIAATMTSTGANAIAATMTSTGANAILASITTAATSYTPTLQLGAGTATGYTSSAFYLVVGKLVTGWFRVNWTQTTSSTISARIFLPITAVNADNMQSQNMYAIMNGSNNVFLAGTDTFSLAIVVGTSVRLAGATANFAAGTSHSIFAQFQYFSV